MPDILKLIYSGERREPGTRWAVGLSVHRTDGLKTGFIDGPFAVVYFRGPSSWVIRPFILSLALSPSERKARRAGTISADLLSPLSGWISGLSAPLLKDYSPSHALPQSGSDVSARDGGRLAAARSLLPRAPSRPNYFINAIPVGTAIGAGKNGAGKTRLSLRHPTHDNWAASASCLALAERRLSPLRLRTALD